jgi:hypothetical protein
MAQRKFRRLMRSPWAAFLAGAAVEFVSWPFVHAAWDHLWPLTAINAWAHSLF